MKPLLLGEAVFLCNYLDIIYLKRGVFKGVIMLFRRIINK